MRALRSPFFRFSSRSASPPRSPLRARATKLPMAASAACHVSPLDGPARRARGPRAHARGVGACARLRVTRVLLRRVTASPPRRPRPLAFLSAGMHRARCQHRAQPQHSLSSARAGAASAAAASAGGGGGASGNARAPPPAGRHRRCSPPELAHRPGLRRRSLVGPTALPAGAARPPARRRTWRRLPAAARRLAPPPPFRDAAASARPQTAAIQRIARWCRPPLARARTRPERVLADTAGRRRRTHLPKHTPRRRFPSSPRR